MKLIAALEQAFKKEQDPLIASGQAAYMKNLFEFHGIPKPTRAQLQKSCFKAYPLSTEEELIESLTTLWNMPHREYHYAACDLSMAYQKLWTTAIFPTFETLIRTKSWWDSVDTIATRLIGPLLLKHPQLLERMDLWIEDENMWIRRTALIFQMSYKNKTDVDRLFAYCQRQMHEQEFFIRKAIGWALRQYSKTNPEAVRAFINKHKERLSTLSFKEASKYC